MLITKLQGGLGNQLFQYAAGRKLSILHQTTIKLDLSWFEQYSSQRYSLGAFNILEAFATKEEIAAIKGTPKRGMNRIAFLLEQKLKPYYRRSVFAEPHLRPYDSNIERTPSDLYLEGYWQSEKYFLSIQDTIRREFTLKYEPDYENRQLARTITHGDSLSVHIRRGDYVTGHPVGVHPPCGPDYYARCVNFISKRVSNPHFFVFSDDKAWAKDNIRFQHETTYVTHNGPDRNYEDLRLMSLCKHNIIANSSFSWWAAWLNANSNKIVLTPSQWFSDLSLDTRNLLPPGWIRL